MWLACYTQEDIAEAVGQSQPQIVAELALLSDLAALPKPIQLSATYSEPDWTTTRRAMGHLERTAESDDLTPIRGRRRVRHDS